MQIEKVTSMRFSNAVYVIHDGLGKRVRERRAGSGYGMMAKALSVVAKAHEEGGTFELGPKLEGLGGTCEQGDGAIFTHLTADRVTCAVEEKNAKLRMNSRSEGDSFGPGFGGHLTLQTWFELPAIKTAKQRQASVVRRNSSLMRDVM